MTADLLSARGPSPRQLRQVSSSSLALSSSSSPASSLSLSSSSGQVLEGGVRGNRVVGHKIKHSFPLDWWREVTSSIYSEQTLIETLTRCCLADLSSCRNHCRSRRVVAQTPRLFARAAGTGSARCKSATGRRTARSWRRSRRRGTNGTALDPSTATPRPSSAGTSRPAWTSPKCATECPIAR